MEYRSALVYFLVYYILSILICLLRETLFHYNYMSSWCQSAWAMNPGSACKLLPVLLQLLSLWDNFCIISFDSKFCLSHLDWLLSLAQSSSIIVVVMKWERLGYTWLKELTNCENQSCLLTRPSSSRKYLLMNQMQVCVHIIFRNIRNFFKLSFFLLKKMWISIHARWARCLN